MSETKVLTEIEDELKSLQQARKLERDTLKGIQFKVRPPVNQSVDHSHQIKPEEQIEVEGYTIDKSTVETNNQSNNQSSETIGEEPIYQRSVPRPVNPLNNQIQPGASKLVKRTFITLFVLGAWGGLTAWGLYTYSKDEKAQSKNVRVRTQMSSDLNRMVGGSGVYISEDDIRRLKRWDDIDRMRREEKERNSWKNYLPSFMRSKKPDQSVDQSNKQSNNQTNTP